MRQKHKHERQRDAGQPQVLPALGPGQCFHRELQVVGLIRGEALVQKSGEAVEAEAVLRRAAAQPNAPAEARQNLAVAIALQGRFDEAEQIVRIDLPPAQAAANMTYLRGLLSDHRRWDDLGRPG